MGIEKFHSWLKNTYYSAIKEYDIESYDHVYFDLNFLLHRVISYVSTEEELINKVTGTIYTFIQKNKQLKTLNLASDGSASYAKIMLQRHRRLMTVQTLGDTKKINPLHLTPGTIFMMRFNSLIRYFTNDLLKKDEFKHLKINLNLSDEPDEAEFKICRMIRTNACNNFDMPTDGKITYSLDTHLIFSNDADSVLIAMALDDIYNINIIVMFGHGNMYIISIDLLIEQQMEMYGYNLQKRQDFVFVSLLNGNDYFPKLKYSNFDRLWNAYKSSVKPHESIVQKNHELNVEVLIKFLMALEKIIPKKFNNVTLQDVCHNDVREYLFGIRWCMSLYSSGEYLTYDYIYDGQLVHPASIAMHILLNGINIIKHETYEKIPSDIYVVLITPYSAKQLIPKKYHGIIEKELEYIYEEEFCQKCAAFREHIVSDNNKCSMKKYMLHRKKHNIKDAKKYINDI